MKNKLLTSVLLCICIISYAQDKPTAKPAKQMKMMNNVSENPQLDTASKNDGVFYGVLQYKSAKPKANQKQSSQKMMVVIMRDVTTNQILDVTTTDENGKFMFEKMKYPKMGVNIEWYIPSLKWPWKKKRKCLKKLEPTVTYIEEICVPEDDSTLTLRLMAGYCICVTDPCPCADPLDTLFKKMSTN